ncbi:MAG: DUF5689 domain-containing protein [Bacteroidales bacterium]|nr:DUF5689 domain-containing protein [Bacteroidales bacterium]
MKKVIKLSVVLIAVLGVMLASCKKDYPKPPIQVLPIGEVYTIGDILNMESGTVFNEDASVYGIVTADEKSGNFYKMAFLQDRATGDAIELYMDATSGLTQGDSIRIYLKDVTYAMYNGLPQLSGFEADGHIVILANDKDIEPVETTLADVVAGNHLAGLVKLSNVMFTDRGTFADPTGYGNRTLVDPSNLTQSVIVRTSNYANFANDSLPQGVGSMVAIASVYNTTWQLMIRSSSELDFEGYNPGGGDAMTLPYYQSFASNFGTYTTFDALGDQSWEIDYSTAKMAGYANGVNYANEDWLISSPVSLADADGVSMTMTYIARYFNNLDEDITIQVSSDYQTGDPNDATWVQVPASWTSGSDWNTFAQTTIDLSQFVGQTVRVAVKYLSTDVKAGTIEVQSIAIQEGSGPTPPGPNPGGEVQSMPYMQFFESDFGTYMTYDVYGDQSWMIDYQTAKMTGYVDGVNHANEDWLISSPVAVTGVNDAKMTVSYIARYFNDLNTDITFWGSTDYVYGDDPSTATWTQVPATLVMGSNWTDFSVAEIALTPFVGQTATFAVKYYSSDVKAGTIEIKSITIEEGSGDVPPTPPTPGEIQSMPYVQSFTAEFGSYATYDVAGDQSWMIDYQTAKMTGYVDGTNYANEDWLISSPVAITGVEDAKMSLIYIGRYFNDINSDITIWFSTDYSFGQDPYSATWTQVPATLVQGSNWTDFNKAEIPLTQFVGQTGSFGVKYLSDAKAGTIEIQSIAIEEGSGETPPTPPGPGEGEGSGTAEDPYNVASGINLQGQDVVAWVQGYIVGCVKPEINSVSSNDDISWTEPFERNSTVLIADDPSCTEISQCIIVNLPSGKPLRTDVNLVDHPDNFGKVLAVNGKLRAYFGQAGLRDSGGTYDDFVLQGYVPPTPPTPDGIFSESFMNDQGTFTIQDVVLPSELTYVWSAATNYQCMKASAYVGGQAYETESWLVSPAIEIPQMNMPTLQFEQAVNYVAPGAYLSVMITTNYTGDVTTTEWTTLTLDSWPAGTSFEFLTSKVDLTDYVGQTIVFAFKYTSSSSESPTWEVKNVVIN